MARRARTGWDPRRLAPPAVAAVLAAMYLIWQPPSLDLAAAEYRAWLFGHSGFALWNAQWYGGHHLLGYSVIFPPLAHWLGPRVLGALAVVAAAALFERLAHGRYGERAWLGAIWFAAGAATTLYSGRITFALGLLPALASLWALSAWAANADRAGGAGEDDSASGLAESPRAATAPARRPGRARSAAPLALLAILLALVTPLASPVDALFLALAGVAWALAERRWLGLAVAVATMAPVAVLAIAFPEGGVEPFVFSSFWPVLAFAAAALWLLPREERALRIGVALYALGCAGAFVLETPVGGNVVRLGALAAGPVAALVLWRRRKLALLLLAPFLLWWQWNAAVSDVRTASGDPSVHAAYYAPLLAELDRLGATEGGGGRRTAVGTRLEIPFTRLHWESRWVAAGGGGGRDPIPLARGWERQLDVERNAVFYKDGGRHGVPLTASRYRAWLRQNAVRWVALPDVRLDYSAKAEARLVARGLPYLRLVWRSAHWRLYAVRDPTPLADPPATVIAAGTDSLVIASSAPASVRLRVRWTPYWAVVAGDACVEPDGDWTRLRVRSSGIVGLGIRFSPERIAAHSARCANANVGIGG